MAYIVHGATGAQGAPILSALLAAGADALGAVRHPQAVPAGRGVRADLADAAALTRLYSGADGVFVHLPLAAPGVLAAQAAAIGTAIAQASPARVVISTSGHVVDEPGSPLQAGPDSPIASLIDAVQRCGVPTAVVAPRLFLDNLLLPVVLEPVLDRGVLRYPLGADYPVSWVGHADVARVAARLLTGPVRTGTVGVGALPGLTGADLAQAFSQALGRPVRYEAVTPARFGALLEPLLGPAAAGVTGMYEALAAAPDNVIAQETSAQELLGLGPRRVAQWVADQRIG